ncbi:MAG: phosphatidate cytidylyltransferase [Sphingobacteriaceae bacterium]|nr:phosphatidate cytidylyltransferase [Sphingobacteriaceae bacterium]
MKTRAITAFFFAIIMLSSFFFGAYVFTAFYLSLSIITLLEFYKLVKTVGIRPHRNMGVLVAAITFSFAASFHFLQFDTKYLLLLVPMVFSIFISELYKKEKIPFANIAYTFIGFIYVTVPFCFFYALGFLAKVDEFNFHLPLAFILMLWANDTGAYLFGVKWGKTKLFERHSPKKSWEGFIGGVFTTVVAAYFIAGYFTDFTFVHFVGMAIIISFFGTLGDLIESMLKRSLDAKDSGSFLPGHGGFLDRFDGLLLAAPIVYVYLYLIIK